MATREKRPLMPEVAASDGDMNVDSIVPQITPDDIYSLLDAAIEGEIEEAVKRGITVYFCDEKRDVNTLRSHGIMAVTWHATYRDLLRGAQVVAVGPYAETLALELYGVVKWVKVVDIGCDVADWLAAGHTMDELHTLVERTPDWAPEPTDELRKQKRATQTEIIVSLATTYAELWHTPDGTPWTTVTIDGHREHYPLRSAPFHDWMGRIFYMETGRSPSSQAWQEALGTLAGMARWDGDEHPVFVRVAEHDGAIYIDLANEAWQAVRVTAAGWEVVDDPPVRFQRPRGMLSLPMPKREGDIEELRPFVNVADVHQWRLLVAWLVATYRLTGPYPILILQGEQGSAKSTTSRVLRSLVDPNIAPLRTVPRNEQDLAIAANNGWVIGLDNLSGVKPWLSDALCRVATGGGFATRKLYEDNEEALFNYQRPIILNGIDDIATRQDLVDRSLILNLPPIRDAARRTEADFWREWEVVRPRVFGALLDAVATALERVDNVQLPTLPRMADFAVWATAAEVAFGWEEGSILNAYAGNRSEAIELGLEGDEVAVAVRKLVAEHPDGWTGTPTELLQELNEQVSEETRNLKTWPKSLRALNNRLRRIATALRQTGIEYEAGRKASARWVSISKIENDCIQASQASLRHEQAPNPHDDGVSRMTDSMTDSDPMTDDASRMTDDDTSKSLSVIAKEPMNKGLQRPDDANDANDTWKHGLSGIAAAKEVDLPW